ncbi:MAG: single-stranded DNA-binding protein [Oscillospiraceae bacterium]|nr:single-stranded DNA-binding protein [Oscillospiraceae bacterium]
MEDFCNAVNLCGTLAGRPVFSHNSKNEEFYTFPLEIVRLSGNADIINIIADKRLLDSVEIGDGDFVEVSGEVRSNNNKSGEGRKLIISVLAKRLAITDGEDENSAVLHGVLCKQPTLRRTPMGRQICDIMLAVNRRYGKSDYIPCIAWGQTAEEVSELSVGDRIRLEGRLQSRKYIKTENGESQERTAYEVSAINIEKI